MLHILLLFFATMCHICVLNFINILTIFTFVLFFIIVCANVNSVLNLVLFFYCMYSYYLTIFTYVLFFIFACANVNVVLNNDSATFYVHTICYLFYYCFLRPCAMYVCLILLIF